MHKRQKQTFAGIGALGAAAILLGGCGGNSFSKNSYGNYPNTLPYAYGLEPIGFYGTGNATGAQGANEGSGFQDATSGQAYITGALAFTATAADGATLPQLADPNATGTLPLGFSVNGQYVDVANQLGVTPASVTSIKSGASVVFRAALANGIANNSAASITGATLTSTDPALASVAGLTAGLPMTLDVTSGAFSNATYVTGTGGKATPFTIPAGTTSGIHTAIVTVSDSAGRVTATTFEFPVVTPTDVALFIQGFMVAAPTTANPAATAAQAVTPGDTVTIDGGPGIGTYPTGYAATTADAQGTVILFTTPGAHTVTETDPKGTVIGSATFTLAADTAGTTQFSSTQTFVNSSGGSGTAATIRARTLRRH